MVDKNIDHSDWKKNCDLPLQRYNLFITLSKYVNF